MNDTQKAQQLFNSLLSSYDAKVKASQANAVDEIRSIRIDLSKQRSKDDPLKISFPFKNVRIEEATDTTSWIRLIPESNDQGRGDTILRLKDNFSSEFGFSSCYLYWDSQPTKEIVIKFYTTSKVDNGSLILDQNNANNVINVGEASLENDELTIVTKWQQLDLTSVTQPSSNNAVFRENHQRYDEKIVSVPDGISLDCLTVPMGYDLHLVSCEIEFLVDVAGTGPYLDLQFLALHKSQIVSAIVAGSGSISPNGSIIPAIWPGYFYDPLINFKRGVKINTLDFTDNQLPGQPSFGVVPEGYIPFIRVNKFGTFTAGSCIYRLAGRLVKKVG